MEMCNKINEHAEHAVCSKYTNNLPNLRYMPSYDYFLFSELKKWFRAKDFWIGRSRGRAKMRILRVARDLLFRWKVEIGETSYNASRK